MPHIDVVCTPYHFLVGWVNLLPNFLRGVGGLGRASIFRGVLLEKEGVTFAGKGAGGCSFYIRKLKFVMKKKGNFN